MDLSPVGDASAVHAPQYRSGSPDSIVKSPTHASSVSNVDILQALQSVQASIAGLDKCLSYLECRPVPLCPSASTLLTNPAQLLAAASCSSSFITTPFFNFSTAVASSNSHNPATLLPRPAIVSSKLHT
ncbi:UNVERIFIED_CONTAM: hypothetical protein FKN15_064449 [Acipenser sinensis]